MKTSAEDLDVEFRDKSSTRSSWNLLHIYTYDCRTPSVSSPVEQDSVITLEQEFLKEQAKKGDA